MRRVVISLLVFSAAFCLSAFPVATGKVEGFWPDHAKHPLSLILAGTAGLFFLLAAIGLVWHTISIKRWRGLVVMAASLSLALCLYCFAPWMVFAIVCDTVLLWGVVAKGWTTDIGRRTLSPGGSAPPHPLLHIPVPWIFVLAYFAGVCLQVALPLPTHSAPLLLTSRIAGSALMVGGLALAVWCLGLFHAARTTTIPNEPSGALVVSGPYRLSRNPMYVSLTLMYLGEAGLLAQVWPLLLLPLVFVYLCRIVIPVEEARLREVFGASYERYCVRVRRWV